MYEQERPFDYPRSAQGETRDRCTNPGGHDFVYTGTAHGGDGEDYFGKGRCYCIHCGADGAEMVAKVSRWLRGI